MSKRQIVVTAVVSTFLTVMVIGGSRLFFSRAAAAPARQATSPVALSYVSVSGLVFQPLEPNNRYTKNRARQLLTTAGQSRANNIFVAPLFLPDRAAITGLTIFGEDFDNQGAVQVRLKRCDHGQTRCVSLAQPTSTNAFALGQFETVKTTNLNETVNNNLYSYYLELEITALANSGLRSVRLELVDRNGGAPPVSEVETWRLSGDVTNFVVPNRGVAEVRVCTNDLAHLPNSTHYPTLVVDGRSVSLSSDMCRTVVGSTIEIRRSLNTGPSSGTYQILR